jgi:hypothetical protein
VEVRLEDHYTGDEINAALARDEGFTGAFPGETSDDQLGALRELFMRKALIARQAEVCEELLGGGATAEQVVGLSASELPDTPAAARCTELRHALGIDAAPGGPALVQGSGEPLTVDQLQRWLRMARLVRTSLEANGGICRALLQVRHGLAPDHQEVAR